MSKLIDAVKLNDNKAVESLLLAKTDDVNAVDETGWTALHYAARNGNLAIANALVNAGANVNARSKSDDSPLHLVCHSGNPQIVALLVKEGANISARNTFDNTALHNAAALNCCPVIFALAKLGADLNLISTAIGNSPLHSASQRHFQATLALLLLNARTDIKNEYGKLPVDLSVDYTFETLFHMVKTGQPLDEACIIKNLRQYIQDFSRTFQLKHPGTIYLEVSSSESRFMKLSAQIRAVLSIKSEVEQLLRTIPVEPKKPFFDTSLSVPLEKLTAIGAPK